MIILAGGLGTRLSELTDIMPKPMDTLRDKMYLEELWTSNKAPWKTW